MSIAIIDCGGANLRSVQHAFQLKGYEANITTDKTQIGQASHIVIPGVGSAGMVMNALNSLQLTSLIKELRVTALIPRRRFGPTVFAASGNGLRARRVVL